MSKPQRLQIDEDMYKPKKGLNPGTSALLRRKRWKQTQAGTSGRKMTRIPAMECYTDFFSNT
jgi:hypothetical protein